MRNGSTREKELGRRWRAYHPHAPTARELTQATRAMSLNEDERRLSVGEQRADIHTSPTMPAGAVAIEMSTDQLSQTQYAKCICKACSDLF